ncbi:MAG: porin family protein [Aquificae bacterium]|nr:porin family protein [Aquificota bacterium]
MHTKKFQGFFYLLLALLFLVPKSEAVDIEFGKGEFSMEMAVLGFSGKLTTDITTITLNETHRNVFTDRIFINFDITYFRSDTVRKMLDLYNRYADTACSFCNMCPFPPCRGCSEMCNQFPIGKYEVVGFDINFGAGYDVWKQYNNYLGVGLIIGATFPWIKGERAIDYSLDFMNLMRDTETEVMTYKFGPQVRGAFEVIPGLFVHGDAAVAFQKAWVENDSFFIDASVEGSFFTFNLGVDYMPFVKRQDAWSKFYITAGFRYKRWLVKDVKIGNVSIRRLILIPVSDLKMETTIAYFGAGYEF